MDRRPTPAPSSSPLPSLDAVRADPTPAAPAALGSVMRRLKTLSTTTKIATITSKTVYATNAPMYNTTHTEKLGTHDTIAKQSLQRDNVTQTIHEISLTLR